MYELVIRRTHWESFRSNRHQQGVQMATFSDFGGKILVPLPKTKRSHPTHFQTLTVKSIFMFRLSPWRKWSCNQENTLGKFQEQPTSARGPNGHIFPFLGQNLGTGPIFWARFEKILKCSLWSQFSFSGLALEICIWTRNQENTLGKFQEQPTSARGPNGHIFPFLGSRMPI